MPIMRDLVTAIFVELNFSTPTMNSSILKSTLRCSMEFQLSNDWGEKIFRNQIK